MTINLRTALHAIVLCTSVVLCATSLRAENETRSKIHFDTLLGGDSEKIEGAIQALSELSPVPKSDYQTFFKRARTSSDEERRAVLESINAQVPDIEGKFATPERQTAKDIKAADAFDWIVALNKQSAKTAAIVDVLADVSAIRSLSQSQEWEAGTLILEFVFSEEGLIYRDEGGRRLRAMSPYSLPSLIYGSQNRTDASMKRYATYQLERLDRQNSNKAFADTPSETLKIAVLHAFADSGYREAVYTVLDQVNHIAPKVRGAARKAWMEYVSGKPPVPAPKRKLELTGGKKSEEKEPLWLNHRELANVAIRRKLKALKGKAPSRDLSLTQLSTSLFEFYDTKRQKELDGLFEEGQKKSAAGETTEAASLFDQVLARSPNYAKRDEMASSFYQAAQGFENDEDYQRASTYYAKANALAPESEVASEALAKHHLMRGKIAEQKGDDGAAEFARAQQIETIAPHPQSKSKIMLWGAMAAMAAALLVFLLGLFSKRRSA